MRSYSLSLLKEIRNKQYYSEIDGVSVLVKPVPDDLNEGIMDPRVYKESKGALIGQYMIPSFYPKFADNLVRKIRKKSSHKASRSIHNGPVIKKTEVVNGCDMHIFSPTTSLKKLPVLYYLHGGGYWTGKTEVIEDGLKLLVSAYNIVVFSLDYSLAPQFKVPTGHLDAKAGLEWIFEKGTDYGADLENVFVGGDSAGGNIAIYLSEDIRVKGQLLLYPSVSWNDLGLFDIDKYVINKQQKRVIKASIMNFKKFMELMFKLVDSEESVLSPLNNDIKRQVPTFIALAGFDVLKCEGLAYASKLEERRVVMYEGMSHAFIDRVGYYPQSEDCIYEMGDFIMNVIQAS